eukprot:1801053-Pyramimonas_sp.AAC.1
MVADALAKAVDAGVLLSFVGARKHNYGARQPHVAKFASVLITRINRVKGEPALMAPPDGAGY